MGTQHYFMVDREMTLLCLCVCVCVCVCVRVCVFNQRERGGLEARHLAGGNTLYSSDALASFCTHTNT